MDRLLNVATPLDALTVAVPLSIPLPGFVPIARAMEALLLVTALPPASWTVTTGCVPKAVPPVLVPGLVVNASFAALPTVMLNVALVALVRPALVALRVYPVPALSMDKPVKVATPLDALTVAVTLSVPLAGLVPYATVTEALLLVTVLPAAS